MTAVADPNRFAFALHEAVARMRAEPLTLEDFAIGVKMHCLSLGTVGMMRAFLFLGVRPTPRDIFAEARGWGADGYAVAIMCGWWPQPDGGWADAFACERIEVVALPRIDPHSEPFMALALMRSLGAPHSDVCLDDLAGLAALMDMEDRLPTA